MKRAEMTELQITRYGLLIQDLTTIFFWLIIPLMIQTLLSQLVNQLCEEKNVSKEKVVEAIESALGSAFRKEFGEKNQNIKVEFNSRTGESKIFDVKKVVIPSEEEEWKLNEREEILLEEILKINKEAKVGDEIKTEIIAPADYGRIAAQTAKQVIIQKLREAEKEAIYTSFIEKEKELVSGVVQRVDGENVVVDLNGVLAIFPFFEQINQEKYLPGKRFQFIIREVKQGKKGPEIFLSRKDPSLVEKLFKVEVPEINIGTVKIKAIAREAGSRTKIAVQTLDKKIDPIGSCVGQRGNRVQTIINELYGEKIDIVLFSENTEEFIKNALMPAKILTISLNEKEKRAKIEVKKDQYSLAIGRDGQNVRLASKLTDWGIDIQQTDQ